MSNTASVKPLAYSYIRFSTAQQALGDSLRRQVELAEAYCEEHGLTLANASAYRDLGVSAFRSKNIEAGKLAEFIAAVKAGRVLPGSFLIIEQFDRLSRADIDVALRLFLELIGAGIVVVTLSDKKAWDKISLKNVGDLLTAILQMSRANDESAGKSRRLSEVWAQKKKRAADGTAKRIVTSEAPRWLRANADKTGFDVVPELAESVRRVYEMRIDGAGVVAICRRANQEGWPLPGKKPVRKIEELPEDFAKRHHASGQWHQSLVGRILKNRAVLGEYQPWGIDVEHGGERRPEGEPISGYYPPIIDETTFLRAQATALRRGIRPGRRDPHARNWLYGLVKCGACGNSLVRKNKTSAKQPGYSRYYCVARVRGATKCPSVDSTHLEGLVNYVLASCMPLRWGASTSVDGLKARVDVLELEIASSKASINGIADLAANITSGSARKSLLERLEREGTALDEKEAELANLQTEIADKTFLGDEDAALARLQQASREIEAIASGQEGLDGSLRLREELARIFLKIVVHQAEEYVEFFAKGRAEPIWLPFDFVSLEPVSELTDEQIEIAQRDSAALDDARQR